MKQQSFKKIIDNKWRRLQAEYISSWFCDFHSSMRCGRFTMFANALAIVFDMIKSFWSKWQCRGVFFEIFLVHSKRLRVCYSNESQHALDSLGQPETGTHKTYKFNLIISNLKALNSQRFVCITIRDQSSHCRWQFWNIHTVFMQSGCALQSLI